MSNGDLPAREDNPTPPPAPPESGGVLSKFNTFVSAIAALMGSLAAIFTYLNKAAIERIDTKVKDLELRQKVEQASRDYAQLFMDKLLAEERLKGNEKRVQAILSLLNIAAQASASAEGESNAKTRAMTPIVLALLLNEPGGVAEMDESYQYLEDWVAIACADNSTKTRVTALQALGGICQKAIRAGRLDIVVKAVRAFDQLMALVPDDPKDPDYISVVAVRTQLKTFIKKEDRFLAKAILPDSAKSLGEPSALLAEVREAFPEANATAQDTKAKVEAKVASIEEAKAGTAQPDPQTNKDLTALKGGLAQLNAALTTASEVAQAQISRPATSLTPAGSTASPSATGSAGPQPTPIVAEESTTIRKYIQDLVNSDETVQRRSRTQLALLGKTAVRPLVKEIGGRFSHDKDEDRRLRRGAAMAFHFMVQPIKLDDPKDAYWIVSLLRSNDPDTRTQTAEFLMNLETEASLRNCLNELEKLFYEQAGLGPDKGGNAVINACVIVATWARNIGADTPSGIPNTSMPQLALEKAQAWRTYLTNQKKADWRKTVSSLDELIRRAEAVQKSRGEIAGGAKQEHQTKLR